MHRDSASKNMQVTPEQAWEVLNDFGGIHKYHPNEKNKLAEAI